MHALGGGGGRHLATSSATARGEGRNRKKGVIDGGPEGSEKNKDVRTMVEDMCRWGDLDSHLTWL